ncbi:MAG: FMN-binding protein [Sedimentibacter sp.]
MITGIIIAIIRTERGKAAEIVINSIVKQQNIKVDAVTGATNSSKIIMKAVENALAATNSEGR